MHHAVAAPPSRRGTSVAPHCRLSAADIKDLKRDLRILLATNGTLTRILEVMADEEIGVEIVDQRTHPMSPDLPGFPASPFGRVVQRRIKLVGRITGAPFVAADSLIAEDRLPVAVRRVFAETNRPIGEVLLASGMETFKEAAEMWLADVPDWVSDDDGRDAQVVARRYRTIAAGVPVMSITEYFLCGARPRVRRNGSR
ncbi:chorismate--pyruvate lyase family protein [Mycolicibacterium arenosum]|uniref:Chorismate pyruvate-lyase family protein n=1 Tax=Mycolicibacterium arenosum TaxID=2952157 RepID=A0ABT1LXB6_9MYCO|nr:chorismate pyruvate-lyase family protein [Mycolicibacterium sp. CAU 1645]MCP9271541.1 chorismate pyruvate-lyase family protein [Mycolicibacterium sp. CAU 1645]